jgi:hypothetical protein
MTVQRPIALAVSPFGVDWTDPFGYPSIALVGPSVRGNAPGKSVESPDDQKTECTPRGVVLNPWSLRGRTEGSHAEGVAMRIQVLLVSDVPLYRDGVARTLAGRMGSRSSARRL